MPTQKLSRNLGMDLVRTTEAAAMSAARYLGLGQRFEADQAATAAMIHALNSLDINGRIVIGEEGRSGASSDLISGKVVGSGAGMPIDVVVDPIDGRRLLAQGRSGALAVAAVALQGAMWSPAPAAYMEKLVVSRHAAAALVPECLDAPAAWTLALVARALHKPVRDLVVFVLERPRHADLIGEIRAAGARVMLADDGDINGAILAAVADGGVDLLMGIGGAAEAVITACAIKALGGGMLTRLAPQSRDERDAINAAGLSTDRILSCNDLVAGDQLFFVATGITDSPLLRGVQLFGERAHTNSMVLRGQTRTRRTIFAEHLLE
ncbi:MAG: class II fructose-bisphosphatase [Oscillochloris sp.]|nr:class II fructose-bisphosphatase [Oscillochloris sp.]